MTDQEKLEPWQIQIRQKQRKLEKNLEAFQRLENLDGSAEEAEKLLKKFSAQGEALREC